jgi:Zn-dependent protease with chaperone function
MATDFFQQQDSARRRTFRLVVYFLLAILCLIVLVYGLLLVAFALAGEDGPMPWWHPELFLFAAIGVGLVVGGSSAFKVAQLASGGQAVALMMGGREVPRTTRDAHERRLLNVVEEMAIAAGVAVPPVYVLEEPGINAFAAGYAPGDAVVAVSQGCLKYLTRDELQGVVAHEFSHILNGDMRLNIRLIGLIFGIMALMVVGRVLMWQSAGRRASSGQRDSGAGRVILGLGLLVLGLVGAFFGRLIQAAVSRQREYLADASAVQFTRNPDGIAGALKKIGGLQEGSRINAPAAAEVAHMFFASAVWGGGLGTLLATHPPLRDRIRRLDPQFDGTFPEVRPVGVEAGDVDGQRPGQAPRRAGLPRIPGLPQLPTAALGLTAEAAASRIGDVSPREIHYAEDAHEDIPASLRVAAQEPFGARAVIYALLLDPRPDVRERQQARLQAAAPPRDFAETLRQASVVQALPDRYRLPLVDLAMPALRQMSPGQYKAFRAQVEMLIGDDNRLSLFEYVLRCVLHRHLDAQFYRRPVQERVWKSAHQVAGPMSTVLSLLAWEGNPEPGPAAQAFAAGMEAFLGAKSGHRLLGREEGTLTKFDAALQELNKAVPAVKRQVVVACASCILADDQVTVREVEVLRAICDRLDCPMPPLLVGEVQGP